MGVPAFFRWLSRKYASIVVHCVEEKPKEVDGVKIPVDSSQPNPNDVEFDNLYLDMNGIIHPCCHPEDRPAPKNENEMMVLIFEYIDRIFSIVRPRRLLYMAIDGVAPRAKMNQQRSRRFRAAKESIEKFRDMARIKAELRAKGANVPEDKPDQEHFDSNCITPGTPFMFRLAECLRFYIHDRLNNDPGWNGIKVILSDANVPGEGEHKIMDYIRRQRAQPDHDPNTHHCLCGADADLIMLGLATHEPHFTIIREEFKPNKPRPCDICGQLGHEMKECTGAPKEKSGEFDEIGESICEEQQFIFLRLNILREYLEKELRMDNLPFEYEFERAIDDWVFMCFFVGNDFLPHLPSLEIREGAIDRLVRLYKKAVYKTGGYLTKHGHVYLERVQLVLSDLGEVEDEIFKNRRETELGFRRRDKEKKKRLKQFGQANAPKFMLGGQYAPKALGAGRGGGVTQNPRQTVAEMRTQSMHSSNSDAAAALRSMLSNGEEQRGDKRKHEDSESEEEPEDDVKLWEAGWKDRYYKGKFSVGPDDIEFRHTVAQEYVIGLCWVLAYYYQGCPSWKWYFPFHYAPFASDFINIGDVDTSFEKNTEPFNPLEQLMGVFPAASKQHLPITWQDLMDNPDSNIIDFYPSDFGIDLNGKKFAWQGVALLPFVDEKRLLKELTVVYPDLTSQERFRNCRGCDRLFVGREHSSHDYLEGLYETGDKSTFVDLNTDLAEGMKGTVACDEFAVLSMQTVQSPLPAVKDVPNNMAISVKFKDPQFDQDFVFPAVVLKGAKFPDRVLKPEDFEAMERAASRGGFRGGRGGWRGRGGRGGFGGDRGGYRPQLGFKPDSGYRDRNTYNPQVANRLVRGSMGGGQGSYGQVPPAPSLMQGGGGYGGRNYNQGNRNQGGYGGGHERSSSYGGKSSSYSSGGYGGGGGGGYNAWQRNTSGGNNAYQQNQQRGYQQQQQQYRGGNRQQQQQYGSQSSGYGMLNEMPYNRDSRDRRSYPPPSNRRY